MKTLLRSFALILILLTTFGALHAQTDQELAEAAVKAVKLFEQRQFTEAIPHFELLLKKMPDHPELRFMYGFALLGKSKQIDDTTEAKKLSAQALEQFQKAKELGLKSPENDTLIAMLSGKPAPPTTDQPMYSANKDAEKLMIEGEGFFAQSNYDEAIKRFEKALQLDPKLYQAAVSGGDSFMSKGDFVNAEKWYQRAIAIDPNRETAYRYSATPLMKQKKFDEARDRYVEAYITEPYSDLSPRGISQWADATGATLRQPAINVPEISFDSTGKATLKTPITSGDPATAPWLAYVKTRETWKKEKFAKTHPKETTYRHSVQEEVEALRATIASAKELKATSAEFALLTKMDTDGVLEPFVLLAIADDDIASEHPEYLKNNRPKLRQYFVNYMISK